MTDAELNDLVARKLGWIDYPEDSIEMGSYWHMEAARAPHGRRMLKRDWNPCKNGDQAFRLAASNGMWLYFGETCSSVDFKRVITESRHAKGEAMFDMCRLICEAFVKTD